ncbi:MAG: GntR family transcriptional regulator [Actinobacteria bacterium]|nr:GntR family transcriptional regulator [Actinomycetota bacterium]
MLLQGELSPGDRLREADLAADLNVSRGSVREGLQALITEGLIEHEMHRGAVVRKLTEADVANIQGIRRLVETAAVRAAEEAPPASWQALEDQLAALAQASAEGDWLAAASSDLEFHVALVALLGNERLEQLAHSMHHELHLILAISAEAKYPDPATLVPDHEELLRLMRAGSTEEAVSLLIDHLAAAEETYLRTIRGAQGDHAGR